MGACGSPEPIYYTLQAVPGSALTAPATSVEVVRPGLAGYLDRSGIVLKQSDYKLDVDTLVRWGEPLGDMIGRVLVQDLSQRLPETSVFSGDGAISADADIRVEVNVQKFDAEADGSAILRANVAIVRTVPHATLAAHSVALRNANVASGPRGLAAAMSELLGQLADQAAADIARR
jgi:uncharacterized lipoprotein YmbA